MQLNPPPSEAERSRAHPTKTAPGLKRLKRLDRKLECLQRDLQTARRPQAIEKIKRKIKRTERERINLKILL